MWKTLDRATGRLLDRECGCCSFDTLRQRTTRLERYEIKVVPTEHWEPYAETFPPSMLVQGKAGAVAIERNNRRMRHGFARFKGKILVVSRSKEMVNLAIALFAAFWVNGNHGYLLSLPD
ncbi:MAG: IS1 family transposase [Thermodesulfobacteriota bacterium]